MSPRRLDSYRLGDEDEKEGGNNEWEGEGEEAERRRRGRRMEMSLSGPRRFDNCQLRGGAMGEEDEREEGVDSGTERERGQLEGRRGREGAIGDAR